MEAARPVTSGAPRHRGLHVRIREPGSARHLALVRVVLCVHVLSVLLSPALPLLQEIGAHPHPLTGTVFPGFLEAFVADGLVVPLATVGAVAAVCGALGLLTRIALPVLFVCFLLTQHYWFRSTLFHDDWLYFCFYLLVLCFAPVSDAWSVDAWLRRRRGGVLDRDPVGYRWPVELMILWFALVYISAGVAKVFPLRKGVLWLTGNSAREFAMEFVRDSPLYWVLGEAPFDYGLLWPFTLASVATVVVEFGAVLLVLTHRWRWWVLGAIVGMHLSIYALGIPGFVQIALVSLVLFLPPERFADHPGRES